MSSGVQNLNNLASSRDFKFSFAANTINVNINDQRPSIMHLRNSKSSQSATVKVASDVSPTDVAVIDMMEGEANLANLQMARDDCNVHMP